MRQIIVLETTPNTGGVNMVRAVFWFSITNPSAQVPQPTLISQATNVPGGMNATEISSIQTGAVLEEVVQIPYTTSTTAATIKADLVKRYADRAAYLATLQPTRQYYGVSYDGTTWSA